MFCYSIIESKQRFYKKNNNLCFVTAFWEINRDFTKKKE